VTMAGASALMGNRVARVSDADRPEFLEAFRELEQFSNRYVREMSAKGLFPIAYPWPLDPLHNWTRWWEYTFAWLHIRGLLRSRNDVHVLDVGSALTFFPLFLAQQGAHVHAFDTDGRMHGWSAAAIERLECLGPDVAPRFESINADCRSTGLADASIDVVTNISVLEHLDHKERAIEELHRVLKPGGVFVNTLDVSVDGQPFGDSMPLDIANTDRFLDHLRSTFRTTVDVAFTHPLDVLMFSNRPRALTRAIADPAAGGLTGWAVKLWHRWLRQAVKVAQSRIFVRPVAMVPVRVLTFAFNSKRLDMWTVLGVVVQK
jgi:SAM-dependent methyltransferase